MEKPAVAMFTQFMRDLIHRMTDLHYTKNEVFPLRISSVNVTKSAETCGFSHIC